MSCNQRNETEQPLFVPFSTHSSAPNAAICFDLDVLFFHPFRTSIVIQIKQKRTSVRNENTSFEHSLFDWIDSLLSDQRLPIQMHPEEALSVNPLASNIVTPTHPLPNQRMQNFLMQKDSRAAMTVKNEVSPWIQINDFARTKHRIRIRIKFLNFWSPTLETGREFWWSTQESAG